MDILLVGLRLTVYGLGLVFLLLALLGGLLRLLLHFDRERPPAAKSAAPARTGGHSEKREPGRAAALHPLSDPTLLAAIAVALRVHRHVRRKQAAPEFRSHAPGSQPSRWLAAGRTRQNRSWSPGGRYT